MKGERAATTSDKLEKKKKEATTVGSTVKLAIYKVHYIIAIFSAALKNKFQTSLHKILHEYIVKESFTSEILLTQTNLL